MEQYYAIIFDIVKSRSYKEQYYLQLLVNNIIDYLNCLYESYIIKKVVCQSGDEYEGLFNNPKAAYNYMRHFRLLAYPIKIRGSIGKGNIAFFDKKWESSFITGEAYYNARDSLMFLPKKSGDMVFINSQFENYLLVNTINVTNAALKSHESKKCHFLEYLMELLYPIDNKMKLVDNSNFKYLINILESKNEFFNEKIINLLSDSEINFEMLRSMINEKNKIENCYEYDYKKNQYIDGKIPYGTSSELAKILNTTKQNINKQINLGNLSEIRANEMMILKLLN